MQKFMKGKNGFTLAELLIVVAIVGVLTAVAIPVFSSQLEKSREATDIANLRSAKAAAVSKYLADDLTDGTFYFDAQRGVLVSEDDFTANSITGYGNGTEKNGSISNTFDVSAIAGGVISISWVDADGSSNENASNYASNSNVDSQIIKITFGDGSGSIGGNATPDPIVDISVTGGAVFEKRLITLDCHSNISDHDESCYETGTFILPWDDLKVTENGTKYGYRADLLTDNAVLYDTTKWVGAFENCTSIKTINLPDSVTNIGNEAFYNCSNLTDITIPDGVTSIGYNAFKSCTNLTDITIPSGVTVINDETFYDCSNLTNVTIPDGVTSIGDRAFYNCKNITDINLPDSVTSIGNSAFYICSNLTNINIPDSVTSIEAFAFTGCGMTNMDIPASVTEIGNQVFENCKSLTSINVDANNPNYSSVDGVLFNKSKKTLITYPAGKPDTTYEVLASVTKIENNAFRDGAFITSVTIPYGVTSIGDNAFANCENLASINLPDSLTNLGSAFLHSCRSLTSVTIPNGITIINYSSFGRCSNLTSLTIPNTVNVISNEFVLSCNSLTEITFQGTKDEWNSITFTPRSWTGFNHSCTIHCTDGDIVR